MRPRVTRAGQTARIRPVPSFMRILTPWRKTPTPMCCNPTVAIAYSTDPGEDAKYVQTPQEAPRQMAADQGAIDYLHRKSLGDRNQFGLPGVNRTRDTFGT